ncbi:MAG: hypothetical protein P4M12_11180 [Gammaproteobacteria bacterium]|nr:hypothetical protein [Gammaproteobacteria bacterium]
MFFYAIILLSLCCNSFCIGDITDIALELHPSDKPNQYQLDVNFIDEKSSVISRMNFKFTQLMTADAQSTLGLYAQSEQDAQPVTDVLSLNGAYKKKQFLTKLISKSQIQDLNNGLETLKQLDGHIPLHSVFVIDVKDEQQKYENSATIHQAENEVVEFLRVSGTKLSQHKQEFYDLINRGHVNHAIREGSLKSTLINNLCDKPQAEFLQNTPNGRGLFCQMGEFIMNGFKQGYSVQAEKVASHELVTLHPDTFFISTTNQKTVNAEPVALDTLHDKQLRTMYPVGYTKLYAADGKYFKALSNIFDAQHIVYKPTTTSCITVQSLKDQHANLIIQDRQ